MEGKLRALALLAVVVAACTSAPSASPAPQSSGVPHASGPFASAEPGPSAEGTTSQDLIAADLASGAITNAQSLLYRAWAAFGDARLPERYDGSGSDREDPGLLDAIGRILPSLDAGQRAELEPFVRRPTDPQSAWSSGGAAASAPSAVRGAITVAATGPPPTRCTEPRRWYSKDWSPDGTDDHGFRVWGCDYGPEAARPSLDLVVQVASTLWPAMTAAEPNGMGPPIPDTGTPQSDGNGKIDVYLLDPLAECRQRGNDCQPIVGVATSPGDWPRHCGVNGFPANACTSYMLINRLDVGSAKLPVNFAHEFFHVLQASHNGEIGDFWYTEASATWAEWKYVATSGLFPRSKQLARDAVLTWAGGYLGVGHSLVRHVWPGLDGYRAVVWPLFESIVGGPETVFKTWQDLEPTTAVGAVDRAIDARFSFLPNFREFEVWNAQPSPYAFGVSTGLDDVRWQLKPDLGLPDPFPEPGKYPDAFELHIGLGRGSIPVDIEAADGAFNLFTKIDDAVRQIEFDASGVSNASNVDLDVLGRLRPPGEDPTDDWRRITGNGTHLTLCRDHPNEDFELLELVVSNHGFTRAANGKDPDAAAQVRGDVVITASDKCGGPDGFTGTFSGTNTIDSWTGTATFHRVQPGTPKAECEATRNVYCYEIISGSVTWSVGGSTKTVSLAPPDAAGEVVLIIDDPAHPERVGTYELSVAPSTEISIELSGSPRYAFETVRAWMNAILYPHTPPDYHLSGTEDSGSGCGIDGCGPSTVWKWDLTPVYDGAP